jgi:hypothetical protein
MGPPTETATPPEGNARISSMGESPCRIVMTFADDSGRRTSCIRKVVSYDAERRRLGSVGWNKAERT